MLKPDELAIFASKLDFESDIPLTFQQYEQRLHAEVSRLSGSLTNQIEERKKALARARVRDAASRRLLRDNKSAECELLDDSNQNILATGEVAKLRQLWGLPPMLVADFGGVGNSARGRILLRIEHLKLGFSHPHAAGIEGLNSSDIKLGLSQLEELRCLVFGADLHARVWARLTDRSAGQSYIAMTDWQSCPAYDDFFGENTPGDFLRGYVKHCEDSV